MPAAAPHVSAPIFLGFCAKAIWPTPPAWWSEQWTAHVTEVCSVSDCLAGRPPGWIERWNFNRAWCWNQEQLALAGIPTDNPAQYSLYAYRLMPFLFETSGIPQSLSPEQLFVASLPELAPEPDLSAYAHLGYDVVQIVQDEDNKLANYGCSPLSCNGMGAQHPVNQFCLLDTLEATYVVARALGLDEPEPGPYVVVEVLRKRVENSLLCES